MNRVIWVLVNYKFFMYFGNQVTQGAVDVPRSWETLCGAQ